MRKTTLILGLCLLIAQFGFSQKKLIIDKDTVVVITVDQLQKANELFVDRKMYIEYSDSLFLMNKKKEEYILSLRTINSLKNDKTTLLEKNLLLCDSVNKVKEGKIEVLNRVIRQEQKKKVRSFFLGSGTAIVMSAVLILIFGK